MSSFAEAFSAFLTDVGASLQEFVETVSTSKDEAAATSQAATVQRPAATVTAPARTRNTTTVELTVDVAHDGSPQALYQEFQDWAHTHGRSTDAADLVSFLQQRQGVTARAWRARDYAGYGSTR